jgi:hypothetical protein
MRIQSFIFDDSYKVLVRNPGWSKTTETGLRMLASLHAAGNKARISQLKYCIIYFRGPKWDASLLKPAKLKAWLEVTRPPGEIYIGALQNLNPHNKSTKGIPEGQYCYKGVGGLKHRPDGTPYYTTKCCPHLVTKKFGGVAVPWCNFLGLGSVHNNTTPAEHKKLEAHFGTPEKLEAKLPLFLLWDQVKECSVRSGD